MTHTRIKIVCICGSMRFEKQMRAAFVDLSLRGYIVTGPFVNMKQADPRWATEELAEPIKAALDQLHLAKIDLCDEVVVIAPGGYIGDSTRREIAYAHRLGKRVTWRTDALCPQCNHDDHRCPGCGEPVPHGTVACSGCSDPMNLGALAREPKGWA